MLTLFVYAVLILTVLWVLIDSARLQIPQNGKKPYSALNGPISWGIVCVALWLIGFPVYLYRRARVLKERGAATGASSAVTWIGVAIVALIVACTVVSFLPPSQRQLTEQVRATVVASMDKTFQSNPAQKNIRVKSLSLAHEKGEQYQGLLEADVSGKVETHIIDVTYDGANVRWQIRP